MYQIYCYLSEFLASVPSISSGKQGKYFIMWKIWTRVQTPLLIHKEKMELTRVLSHTFLWLQPSRFLAPHYS